MRSIFLILSLFFLSAGADEIERIERVLLDITQLRQSYDKSQEELSLCSVKLTDEKQKNAILLQELKKVENEVEDLKNQIKKIKNSEKKEKVKKVFIKEKIEICEDNQIKESGGFPKLQLRKEFLDTKERDTTAYTYRLQKESSIFDAIDGEVIEQWESQTSFTSSLRVGDWIKITGYFTDRVWHKAQRELWVKADNAKQR